MEKIVKDGLNRARRLKGERKRTVEQDLVEVEGRVTERKRREVRRKEIEGNRERSS